MHIKSEEEKNSPKKTKKEMMLILTIMLKLVERDKQKCPNKRLLCMYWNSYECFDTNSVFFFFSFLVYICFFSFDNMLSYMLVLLFMYTHKFVYFCCLCWIFCSEFLFHFLLVFCLFFAYFICIYVSWWLLIHEQDTRLISPFFYCFGVCFFDVIKENRCRERGRERGRETR